MRVVLAITLFAAAMGPLSYAAFASGTSGSYGGGGGGSYPSGDRDPAAEAYARGKSMVKKRIACKKCAYPNGVQDTPTAKRVAADIRAGAFTLKPAEREAVLYYLSERFGA